jgi:hypothetical protein
MPKAIVRDGDAQDVAAFAAAYAGQFGMGATVATETAPKAEAPACPSG